jgi:hypothetical protein
MFRRMAAEGLGSLLLAATVIGSGIMAERLAAGNLAVALIANTGATVAVLATLIALLGPVSGAHFNPAVSLVQALLRRSYPGPRDVLAAAHSIVASCANRYGSMARRVRGNSRSLAGRPRSSQGPGCTLDGFCLDRSGLLVHLVHLVRESSHHYRALSVGYLCRYLAVPCSRVHPGAVSRRSRGASRSPLVVREHKTR